MPHTPLALGFAVLAAEGPHLLFIDKRKLPMKTEAYLTQLADLRAPVGAGGRDRGARQGRREDRARSGACRRQAADAGHARTAARSSTAPDPARIPRATKNSAEIAGARAAHRRDGAAVAKLLCWLDSQQRRTRSTRSPSSTSSRRCARRPATRRRCRCTKSPSPPSPAPGPTARSCTTASRNGTNRPLEHGELFLLDSGGQYQDGTTDITRTVPIGHADRGDAHALHAGAEGHDRHFDAALPGRARAAPTSTPSRGWRFGRPASIMRMAPAMASAPICLCMKDRSGSPRPAPKSCLPGMILSNEPGYYKEGEYGIRLENLIIVTPAERSPAATSPMHGFRDADAGAVRQAAARGPACSRRDELHWLDAYHARVLREIGPMVDGEDAGLAGRRRPRRCRTTQGLTLSR